MLGTLNGGGPRMKSSTWEWADMREDEERDEEEEAGRGLWWPGPLGAVWRWNLTKVQRHFRCTHFA
ncbi:hypothetical protein SERLA73DRAFT_182399, partial [Serpula lacrymans var. lacrymans S7.3]